MVVMVKQRNQFTHPSGWKEKKMVYPDFVSINEARFGAMMSGALCFIIGILFGRKLK